MEAKESIEAYYESIKEQYPDLTHADVDQICRAPFAFLKKVIDSNKLLPSVRYKYLGVFRVELRMAVYCFKNLDRALAENKMTLERYELLKVTLPEFIRKHKRYKLLKEDTNEFEEGTDNEGECDSIPGGEPEV